MSRYLIKPFVSALFVFMFSTSLLAEDHLEEETAPTEKEKGKVEQQQKAMNNQRLGTLIKQIDEKVSGQPGRWQFKVQTIPMMVLTDERADRMRIMVRITKASVLGKDQLYRLLQANFDSALDARYALAHGDVWAVFIHPLSPLSDQEFYSGVLQTLNITRTYGSSFSSNILQFQGGDLGRELEKLRQKQQQGKAI